MDYTTFGIALIITGIILFVIELNLPGFFIAIPATMVMALGIMAIVLQEKMDSPWVAVISIIILIVVLYGTMLFYKSLAPPEMTDLTPMGLSLKGKLGTVVDEVRSDNNTGKVRIKNTTQVYRARAVDGEAIPPDTEVRVTDYQGITLIVKPLAGTAQSGGRGPAGKV